MDGQFLSLASGPSHAAMGALANPVSLLIELDICSHVLHLLNKVESFPVDDGLDNPMKNLPIKGFGMITHISGKLYLSNRNLMIFCCLMPFRLKLIRESVEITTFS